MDLLKTLGDKSFAEVKLFLKEHKFSVKESELHPTLYLITYHNLHGVDWSQPWTIQCRGTVLQKGTNRIVCYPFDKFFNSGERYAVDLDWSTAQVQEKVDGSLIKVYYHDHPGVGWVVASNGTIDAKEAPVSSGSQSFFDLFLEALKGTWEANGEEAESQMTQFQIMDIFQSHLDPQYTYLFEMLHPISQVVVPVERPMLYHLATRDMQSFREIDHVSIPGIPKPRKFPFLSSLEGCKSHLLQTYLTSNDGEGFVVCDASFRRLKIKSEAYFLMHSKKSVKPNLVLTVLDGESSEILAYFPHLKEELDRTASILDQIKTDFSDSCEAIRNLAHSHHHYSLPQSDPDSERLLKKNIFLTLSGNKRFSRVKHIALDWSKKEIFQQPKLDGVIAADDKDAFLDQWMRRESEGKIPVLIAAYILESEKK